MPRCRGLGGLLSHPRDLSAVSPPTQAQKQSNSACFPRRRNSSGVGYVGHLSGAQHGQRTVRPRGIQPSRRSTRYIQYVDTRLVISHMPASFVHVASPVSLVRPHPCCHRPAGQNKHRAPAAPSERRQMLSRALTSSRLLLPVLFFLVFLSIFLHHAPTTFAASISPVFHGSPLASRLRTVVAVLEQPDAS